MTDRRRIWFRLESPFPPQLTFPRASLSSRTVGFPESGWQQRHCPSGSSHPVGGLSARSHTPLHRIVVPPVRHRGPGQQPSSSKSGLRPAIPCPPLTESPFAMREVLSPQGRRGQPPRPELPDHHRSYELMRQTKCLCTTQVSPLSPSLCRLLRAPADKWSFPTLSPPSLCRRLDPYPVTLLRCIYPLLPEEHRPHHSDQWFGAQNIPSTQFRKGKYFEAAVIPLCSGSHTH